MIASSNNGAVQNIVLDLPKEKDIDKTFLDALYEVDYFTEASNLEIKNIYNKESKKYELKTIPQNTKNWGMFSIKSGASNNVNKLLDKVKVMLENLNEWDVSLQEEEKIIENFNNLYNEIDSYKQKMQELYLESMNLDVLKDS